MNCGQSRSSYIFTGKTENISNIRERQSTEMTDNFILIYRFYFKFKLDSSQLIMGSY